MGIDKSEGEKGDDKKPVGRHTMTAYISLNTKLCQACWSCVEACPNGVIGKVSVLFHKHARIDYAEKCEGCGICVDTCTNQAIAYI